MDRVVTWPVVVLALVTGAPAIIAAIVSLLNRKQLKTANGKTLAATVEEVHAATAEGLPPEPPPTPPPAQG